MASGPGPVTASDAGVRAFIAIHLSGEVRQRLSDTIRSLGSEIPSSVRWVNPEGIHLTLKFLGDIDLALVADVLRAMEQAASGSLPFHLQLKGLGVFPNHRRPRVLWVGLEGDLDALGELHEELEAVMSRLNFPLERRTFSPHLTLGRVQDGVSAVVRQRVGAVVSSGSLDGADSWPVNAIHLMRSDFTPGSAVYSSLGSVRL